jgi:hypothetical protein
VQVSEHRLEKSTTAFSVQLSGHCLCQAGGTFSPCGRSAGNEAALCSKKPQARCGSQLNLIIRCSSLLTRVFIAEASSRRRLH